jgi:multidrug efflux pump subunit AcrB
MIRYFSQHPTAANLLMAALILLGLLSLPDLKRETFPEFSSPYLLATIVYPSASPREVEQTLCVPMENALDGQNGVSEIRCEALEGRANLRIKLTDRTSLDKRLLEIQTRMAALDDLPADSETPLVRELNWSEPVIDVAVTAPLSAIELTQYGELLKRQLQHQYGVNLVTISGVSEQRLYVDLDPFLMRKFGLTLDQVHDGLRKEHVNLPSGSVSLNDHQILLRVGDKAKTAAEFGQYWVASTEQGEIVRLSDIATVYEGVTAPQRQWLFDGDPALLLRISKSKTEDALVVKSAVLRFVDDINAENIGNGIQLRSTNDLSSVLWDRLSMMVKNGGQGVVLVFFSMWLFFSFRYAFWVAAGLPVAFLGSLFLMAQLGISINLMSLVALLMAIGIMMDDAIVLAESIADRVDRGDPLDEAITQGVKTVFPGIMASFLTTLCVFGSLLFLQGEMGSVLRVIPLVLILVLTLSLLEAFWVLPYHLRHALSKKSTMTVWWGKAAFLRGFDHFRTTTLLRWVGGAMRHPKAVLSGTILLFFIALSLVFSGAVRFVSFPALDGDVVEARIMMPSGTSVQQTQQVIRQVILASESLNADWHDDHSQHLIEHTSVLIGSHADAQESGDHLATVRLDLLTSNDRGISTGDVMRNWKQHVGNLVGVQSVVFKQPAMGPGGRDLSIPIYHDDPVVLAAVSQRIKTYFHQIDGVSAVLDDARLGKVEWQFQLTPEAKLLGLTSQVLAAQVRGLVAGRKLDSIVQSGKAVDVTLRVSPEKIRSLDELARLPIQLPNGTWSVLGDWITWQSGQDVVRILRKNGQTMVSVFADIDKNRISAGQVLSQFHQTIKPELLALYPDVRFGSDGAAKDSAKTGRSMGVGFGIGLFGIFVILSYQFGSYLIPWVIMMTIPLAFIGVVFGHAILGYALSMPSFMGFVSLSGVVVNDSILLVQSLQKHLKAGASLFEAGQWASRDRFRAVFLTSLTTAAGLLPLLLETSLQAQVLKPLVVAIVFGIFASTLLVLFVIPPTYALWVGHKGSKQLLRKEPMEWRDSA